jgi:hypothetical protein
VTPSARVQIINEPEGSVAAGVADADACFDTMALRGTGAGWAQTHPIPMRNVLRFVGVQAAAIHDVAPDALVTVGTWSEHSVSDALGLKNYYNNSCLQKAAGGAATAVLDFAQVHSYATDHDQYNPTSPFNQNVSAYQLHKPLVVGEFQPGKGTPSTAVGQYTNVYASQFDGAWGWTASQPTLFDGMETLKAHSDVSRIVLPHTGQPDTCACSDTPPDTQYTCQQQASWGKCTESWMANYCCRSCHSCSSTCTSSSLGGAAGAPPAASWQPSWAHDEYRRFVEEGQRTQRKRAAAA